MPYTKRSKVASATNKRSAPRDRTPHSKHQGKRRRDFHIFVRDANDWYLEPFWCSARLFDIEPFDRSQPLLDPCTGTGRIADAAKAAGYKVITADLVDRGYPGCKIQDFLKRRSAPPSIVCNPPFSNVEEFARHAFEIGANKVAMILPVAMMNAARPWLGVLPFSHAWLMTPRPSMPTGQYVLSGGKVGQGKRDFCWLIFERGHVGEPVIRWLHKNPAKQQ
jgi:hypothetical protein